MKDMKRKLYRWATLAMMVMLVAIGIPMAITADAQIIRKEGGLQSFPVEASTQIYKGTLVCINTSGYLVDGANTQGYRFVGIAYENVLGTTQGAKSCKVHTAGVFKLTASSITQAMVGRYMYLVDNATVDESVGNALCVGRLVEYISNLSGWVDIGQRQDLLGHQDHLYLVVDKSDKNVRISPTYTAAASIVALQVKPGASVVMTDDCIGIETSPRVNSGYACKGLVGVKSEPWRRGNDNASGEIRGYEATLGTDSGYSGTVTGPVSALKAINNMHGTVTNGVYVIYAPTHGGNKAWDGFANLPDDGQLAKYNDDKTGGTKGWIKVKIGAYTGYINVATLA